MDSLGIPYHSLILLFHLSTIIKNKPPNAPSFPHSISPTPSLNLLIPETIPFTKPKTLSKSEGYEYHLILLSFLILTSTLLIISFLSFPWKLMRSSRIFFLILMGLTVVLSAKEIFLSTRHFSISSRISIYDLDVEGSCESKLVMM